MAEELSDQYESPEAKPRSAKSKSADIMEGLYFGEAETSFQQSPYYPDSQKKPYNPDPIVQRDYTYGIYEDMLQDDQVNVALNLKKDLVVGSGWHISCSDDKVKRELEAILCDDIERPLSEILQDIIQAYEYGFSLSEKLFKNLPDGRLALKNIKPRHPSTWRIHTDPHGNVERFEQFGQSGALDVNPKSLIHYINNERFQNPYGNSDLSPAYQAYITKRHVLRYHAIFLENAAGAKPVAKYDRRAPVGVVEDIFNAIKNLQAKTAMVIPKDFEIDYLEAKNNGDVYHKAINMFNMFIGRSLSIPDLLGFSGSETAGGSFSLGKEQIGVFYKHIFRRREILERIMDQHVIRPLCVYNYGLMEEYPKFKFNPLSDEDAVKQSELWIKGIQGVGYQPTVEEVNHFRSLVKFPESDDLEMKGMVQPGMEFNGESKEEGEGEENEEAGKEAKADKESEKKEFALKLDSLPGDYKKKVNFKLADQNMKATVSKIMSEMSPLIEDAYEDLYQQMQDKKIIQTQDLSRAENLKLKGLGKMQSVLKKHFRRLHDDAQAQAKTEVKKGDFAKATKPLPNDKFLEFLNQETFEYIGKWSYDVTTAAKKELVKAIKDGKPISEVISMLDDDGQESSRASLERYARTKSTEVFNRGRLEYFDSTGVVAAYQFSAILDDVTSEICGEDGLNGAIFEKDEAPIPPLHFNCRSVLIPITRFEEYTASSKTGGGQNIDKFLEKNVSDKGFSVYSLSHDCYGHKKEKKWPQITDPETTFITEIISPTEEHHTYRQRGVSFQKTVIVYTDDTKKTIKFFEHKRLDDAPVL